MHAGAETHYRPAKVYIDTLSQSFLMSASELIQSEVPEELTRISNHRDEVNETIAYTYGTIRIVTVVADWTSLLRL